MMWIFITHVTGLRYSRCEDKIQDLTQKFKMSRQNLRSFQDIQEFKIFLRSWQDIQVVERWVVSQLQLASYQKLDVYQKIVCEQYSTRLLLSFKRTQKVKSLTETDDEL